MTALEPCPSCQRHVRTTTSSCPFCSAPLAPRSSRARRPSGRRLGRYAAFTFQSGLVAAALGCSEGALVPGGGTPGSGGAASGGTTGSGGVPASGGTLGVGGSTGGSPLDGMAGDEGSGGATGGTGTGGDDGSGGDDFGVPIYSAVPPPE